MHYAIRAQCVAMMEDGSVGAQSDSSNASSSDPPEKKAKNDSNKAPVIKGTDEYMKKRARNNEAVRKSRVKSRMKIEETQHRVNLLTKENSDLKTKVTLLTKELNVLRSLFSNGSVTAVTLPGTVSMLDSTLEIKTEPSSTGKSGEE